MGERESWGSRLGFILAAAGSAVGLGNIWGFPIKVGQGGGAIFVLVYLACVAFVCLPVMVVEIAVGRRGQKNPLGSLRALAPGTAWWLVGALGIATGVGILSFYSVIAGWTLAYIGLSAFGASSGTPEATGRLFTELTTNGAESVGLTLVILAATAGMILSGIRAGIERATKILMPLLFLLLVVLVGFALRLPGAGEGLRYYLRPDASKLLDIDLYSAALGQAFFSLSLGMGAMLTYGSYLDKKESIVRSALFVVLLDTTVALLAGFVVFPSGFSIPGFDPGTSGPGLIFVVLPELFQSLPGGRAFGTAFFVLLLMAALTSTISLLEVPVTYLIDEHGWARKRAVVVTTALTFVLSVPSALGNGAVPFLSRLPGYGGDFLSLMARVWNDFSLPIGGLLLCLFVALRWGLGNARRELEEEGAWNPYPWAFSALVRFACPAAIGFIVVTTFLSLFG